MSESLPSNITQIIHSYEHFIQRYENEAWFKSVTLEDIKNLFKDGASIEKYTESLKAKDCLMDFEQAINTYLSSKNRIKCYEMNFYLNACDYLLAKILRSKYLNANLVDVAIRMYTTMYPQDRFEKVLSTILSKAFSFNAIYNHTLNCNIEKTEFESTLILNQLSNLIIYGKLEIMNEKVEQLLANYKIESNFPIVLQILNLDDLKNHEKIVQKFILNQLILKMQARSVIIKPFWLALFKNTEKTLLLKTSSKYLNFCEGLLNIIVYIGSMMNSEIVNNVAKWVSDSEMSICPEISFEDLVSVLDVLYSDTKLKFVVKRKLEDAFVSTSCKLWEFLLKDF